MASRTLRVRETPGSNPGTPTIFQLSDTLILEMNKEELTKEVARKTGLPYSKAIKAVESFFLAIEDALIENQKVTIAGFGTFELTEHKERKVINPKTKQLMSVPALTTARFRPSRILRQKVR